MKTNAYIQVMADQCITVDSVPLNFPAKVRGKHRKNLMQDEKNDMRFVDKQRARTT